MWPNNSGAEVFTSDGACISSGTPVRVFSATVVCGATAGVLQLYNNTSKTGTAWVSFTGTANKSKTENFTDGLLFHSGCYVDLDANCSQAILQCRAEV